MARQTAPTQPRQFMSVVMSAPRTGVPVNEVTAMTLSAVWASVRIISQPIAAMAWHVFFRDPAGASHVDYTDPLDRILYRQPNPEMNSLIWRETAVAHLLTWGNAYAEIERDRQGRPMYLWLITPDRVEVKRSDASGEIVYWVRGDSGGKRVVFAQDMLHFRGLGFDGLIGYSVIRMAAASIGLGLATEQYGGSFFANGSIPGGVLEHPGVLGETGEKNVRESWERLHRGPDQASNIAVLEEGMKYHQVGIPPEDAQFLQTRNFQVLEIARWFGIPPYKIGEMEKANYSNLGPLAVEFVTYTLMPWVARLEQEIDTKLISLDDYGKRYTKININALMRGDPKTRHECHSIGRQWGWLSANDVRELEDSNPLPGDEGDIYLVPGNMIPASRLVGKPDAKEGSQISRAKNASLELFEDVGRRIVSREVIALKRAGAKHADNPEGLSAWTDAFYDKQKAVVVENMRASIGFFAALAGGRVESDAEKIDALLRIYAESYAARAMAEIAEARRADGIGDLCDRWANEKPKLIARDMIERVIDAIINTLTETQNANTEEQPLGVDPQPHSADAELSQGCA